MHSLLPEAVDSSSAVVLNNGIYNLGGDGSSHSVAWCRLCYNAPAKWEFVDLPNYSFAGYARREAFVIENKIVYFGSVHRETTFVLESGEELRVVRED